MQSFVRSILIFVLKRSKGEAESIKGRKIKPRKETFCFKKNLNKNGKNGQRDSTLHCVLLYTYIHQKHVDHSIRSIPIIIPTSET